MAQKVRVFKLATEFGLDNNEMVERIQGLGYSVQNYMSALDEEDADNVRSLLFKERDANTVEEQIRPTVVRRRTKTGAPVKPVKVRPPKIDDSDSSLFDTSSSAEQISKEVEKAVPASAQVKEVPKIDKVVKVEEVSPPVKVQPVEKVEVEDVLQVEPKKEIASETPSVVAPSNQVENAATAIVNTPDKEIRRTNKSSMWPDSVAPEFLRPASEAPLVKRRVKVSDTAEPARAVAKRRKVESREIIPSKRTQGGQPSAQRAATAAVALGKKRKMTPGKKALKTEITTPKAIKRVIKIEGQVTLQELAKRMSVKSTELLMKLMSMGMASININSTLDSDTSKIIAEEFGYEVEDVAVSDQELLSQGKVDEVEDKKNRVVRAPVVTMMGHVDHGKTSLLDFIRKANVADGEAGGITQHVGAYRVKTEIGEIAFIDTPGHAAFTSMRARGADLTDIVIIVCAADDGVMPQTIEAINHARVSKCPIIVAINKCDLPSADVERTRRLLMEQNLIPEELGGDTIIVEVSAKTGKGISQLLEMISLQAEFMELDANPSKPATGVVLEAYLDKGRGPVAHVLIQDGTLDANDIVVAGQAYGKIRAMTNERGQKIMKAGASTPVEVLGLSAVPSAGDTFDVAPDLKTAEKVGLSRVERERASMVGSAKPSLDALYTKLQNGEQAELKVVLKSDVRGTMEAIKDSLIKLSNEKVKVTVVAASVGGITESDILLASTAGAIVIGFNVRPAGKAKKLAEEHGIEINIYSVIYDIIDAIEAAMTGLLAPTIEQKETGKAQVREVFRIPKIGTIAGCYVTEGKVVRNGLCRLIRDSVQIWEGQVDSLRRFKDDVKEVSSGYECGIGLKGFNDLKENDVIEFYLEEEVQTSLY